MDTISYTLTVDMQQVMMFVSGAVAMFFIVVGLLKLAPQRITIETKLAEASEPTNQHRSFFSAVTTFLVRVLIWVAVLWVFVSIAQLP